LHDRKRRSFTSSAPQEKKTSMNFAYKKNQQKAPKVKHKKIP
jgi:hypothetical protein